MIDRRGGIDVHRLGSDRVVLFVCRHGAAKSVLAAIEVNRIARRDGLPIAAHARGTEPDREIAAAVIELLPDEAEWLRRERPRLVTTADIAGAWKTVVFDDLDPATLPALPASLARWDDVPAVSANPNAARRAITKLVVTLLEEATGAANL